MKPQISIIIPTYNRATLLQRVLWSLWQQKCSSVYEVLVSVDDDDDHKNATTEVITKYAAQGMTIRTFYTGQYKRGPGWCVETYPYNVGIRHADADLLLLNSGDVLSITNTIAQHLHFHNNHLEDSAVLFSTVHGLKQEVMQKIDTYPWQENPHSLLFKGSCEFMYCGQGLSYSDKFTTEQSHRPYHYQMSVKKKVLHDLHGFDEDFYGMIPGGDDDLATRMQKYGCSFYYDEAILGLHQWHPLGAAQSAHGFSQTNTHTDVPFLNFYEKDRMHKPIIRNASHEWGQYPRDMANLPAMSGFVNV